MNALSGEEFVNLVNKQCISGLLPCLHRALAPPLRQYDGGVGGTCEPAGELDRWERPHCPGCCWNLLLWIRPQCRQGHIQPTGREDKDKPHSISPPACIYATISLILKDSILNFHILISPCAPTFVCCCVKWNFPTWGSIQVHCFSSLLFSSLLFSSLLFHFDHSVFSHSATYWQQEVCLMSGSYHLHDIFLVLSTCYTWQQNTCLLLLLICAVLASGHSCVNLHPTCSPQHARGCMGPFLSDLLSRRMGWRCVCSCRMLLQGCSGKGSCFPLVYWSN